MEKQKPQSNYDTQVDIARAIFLEYDQAFLIRKFHLDADAQWIYLTYMNTPFRICRKSGQIDEFRCENWMECRSYSTVMTIYDLLCYHQGPEIPPLSHQWCAVGSFIITGVQNTGTFTQKYAALFDGRLTELQSACRKLGGILQSPMSGADMTCILPVTSFFPVLLQFWEGDDEFPPKILLMWDRNANAFLHFETTFYLQGDLLERLRDCTNQ